MTYCLARARKKMIHGIVHDENAFLMGGVSGHAGIFSNAEEIGKIGMLFLNKGFVNGKRIFSEDLINQFIQSPIEINTDYTLGWDKPLDAGNSSAGKYFSISFLAFCKFSLVNSNNSGCTLDIFFILIYQPLQKLYQVSPEQQVRLPAYALLTNNPLLADGKSLVPLFYIYKVYCFRQK